MFLNPTLKRWTRQSLAFVGAFLLSVTGRGQEAPQQTSFSLPQAVSYALAHNVTIKNSETDYQSSRGRVGEITATILPQISGNLGYTYFGALQRQVIETGVGGAAFFGRSDPSTVGLPIGLVFGLPNVVNMGVSLYQPIFNPSFVSLPAAKVYTTLVNKQMQKTRQDVKAQVSKAYYQLMVGQEQAKVLDYNLARLDTGLRDLRANFKAGFVEQIDVYRLEVQRNNLATDRETTTRSIALATAGLKLTMGYPMQQPLTVTDKLESAAVQLTPSPESYGGYQQRLDYDLLQTQETLAIIDLKAKKAAYIPSLSLNANLGANTSASNFRDMVPPYRSINGNQGKGLSGRYDPIFDGNDSLIYGGGNRWYSSAFVGVNLSVPIWDSYSRYYIIKQSKLALKKVRDNKEALKNAIDFDIERANISTQNAGARLATQQRNLALAQEVVRVTKVKYKQGLGSSLEVTNAETDLRVAQTNYYAALYDALVAKIDADVAAGRFTADEPATR